MPRTPKKKAQDKSKPIMLLGDIGLFGAGAEAV
jgi:hypothetical protein